MNAQPPPSNQPFNREFFATQLLVEYQRRSDVVHKSIDNSYVISGITFTTLGGLVLLSSGQGNSVFGGITPFIVLCLIYLDSQIRTTFFTNAKHLEFLERRINKVIGYKLLLWESKLTPGRLFYYKKNHYFIFRALSITSFLCVAAITYLFAVYKFAGYLQRIPSVHIFSLSIPQSSILWTYYTILGITTISTLASWVFVYLSLSRVYEQFLEQTFAELDKEAQKP